MKQEKLIEVKNLKTFFNTEAGIAKAVDGKPARRARKASAKAVQA